MIMSNLQAKKGKFGVIPVFYKIKNFLFLLPSGKILAEWKSHTNGGRLNETPGNKGTHDYNKLWDSRNIYGEKDLIK